ncbi:uncharacterized protein LOC123318702 [Coccinella septempunctata]|uniref:uncharacterized protein LOC123318702 n=1 Tax=Coccinella septempunctata TaxID=41139 RepID=UPI001D07B249|nr:uncharacterized protein LOC123318702 [Coccinella septempunctata]
MKHTNIVLLCNFFIISHSLRPPIIWKDGINWVQMVVGIGIPVDLKDATITIGSAAKAYYLLPTNTSYPTYTTYEAKEGRSSLRQGIYNAMEDILRRYGFGDGKSCLLKLICEYATKDASKHSLISRVADVVLRPSSTVDATERNIYSSAEKMGSANIDCNYLFSECKNDITNTFLKEFMFA